jgi:hypothetical protein
MLVAGPLMIGLFFTVLKIKCIVRYKKHKSFFKDALNSFIVAASNLLIILLMRLLTFGWLSYTIIKLGGPIIALFILLAIILCQAGSLRRLIYRDCNLAILLVLSFIGDFSYYLWQGISLYNMYHVS